MKLAAFIVALLFSLHLFGPDLAEAPVVPWTRYQCGVASDRIRVAIQQMGPGYAYRLDGLVLRVSIDEGNSWRRLRY